MIITVNKQELLEKLIAAAKCTGESKIRPIISCVLLSATDTIKLNSTDLEMTFETLVLGEVHEQGKTCFNPQDVIEYVSTLDNGEIEVILEGNILKVYEAEFITMDSDEYPVIKTIETSKTIEFDNTNFIEYISNCMKVAIGAADNPACYGVKIEINDKLNFVATDSFRMITYNSPISDLEPFAATLPYNSAKKLIEILKSSLEPLKLNIDKDKIEFISGLYKFSTRTITLDFPNYKSILNSFVSNKKVTVNRNETIKIFKRMLVFAKNNVTAKNGVMFDINNNKVNVKALADKGKAKDKIDCIQEGGDIKISLNAQFVLDYILQINSEAVEILLSDSNKPIIIQPASKNNNSVYVTMPLSLIE